MKYGTMFSESDFERIKHTIDMDNLLDKCCYKCEHCVWDDESKKWYGLCCEQSTQEWDAFVSIDDCCGSYKPNTEDET